MTPSTTETPELRKPAILAVDDDPDVSATLDHDLSRRFAADYRIVVARSAEAGVQQVQQLRDQGVDVALVIAGWRLRGMSGIDLLIAAHRLHPDARRVLLITYGDAASADTAIAAARALGQIDCYITKPWASPEEWLYVTLTERVRDRGRLGPCGPWTRPTSPTTSHSPRR